MQELVTSLSRFYRVVAGVLQVHCLEQTHDQGLENALAELRATRAFITIVVEAIDDALDLARVVMSVRLL